MSDYSLTPAQREHLQELINDQLQNPPAKQDWKEAYDYVA